MSHPLPEQTSLSFSHARARKHNGPFSSQPGQKIKLNDLRGRTGKRLSFWGGEQNRFVWLLEQDCVKAPVKVYVAEEGEDYFLCRKRSKKIWVPRVKVMRVYLIPVYTSLRKSSTTGHPQSRFDQGLMGCKAGCFAILAADVRRKE